MDAALTIGAVALGSGPLLFAAMTVVEVRRVRRFLRHGMRTEGEVIGEELHGIRFRAPYPVIRFRDASGSVRQFRSLISKRSRDFIHPGKVMVIYMPDRPDKAELFSGFHPYKHLVGIICMFALSIVFAVFALPMFFER